MRHLALAAFRSRAVHFAILGTAIFALSPRPSDPTRITISARDLDAVHAAQAARAGAPALSPKQVAEVDERVLEDEVLYREALRLGLDRGDNVVRQHLVQKMLLFAEDMGGATRTPTEADLRAFFDADPQRWTRGESVHFIHVFSAKHEGVNDLAARVRDTATTTPPDAGDAFPSSRDVSGARAAIGGVYGDAFAGAVFAQPVGAWGAPIESKFGWHVVRVLAREPGRPARFEEVKDALALEWAVDRRHHAIAQFLARAEKRYQINVDDTRTHLVPAERLARRLDPSGED